MMDGYNSIYDLLEDETNIACITEDKANYYVLMGARPGELYHDEIWVVNKQTRQVSLMGYIPYMLDIEGQTTSVELSTFKESLK